jgi:predicted DNA-binding transcriptional regulator AlpA
VGLPIIANSGAAVGVVSTGPINPRLARDLPGWLAPKAIRWWRDHDRYVRYPELKSFGVSYSRQHIAALEADGRFPERVYLSERVTAWYLSEIVHWMNTRDK